MAQPSSILLALPLLLASTRGVVGAQGAAATSPPARYGDGHSAADRYEPVFEQLRHMTAQGDRVATVRNLTLRRDVIAFQLEEGQLFVGTPVAGRTIAAMFVGHGSVSFAPPTEIERRELKRVMGDSVLNARISAVAFVFTDSTLAELERQVTFQGGGQAGPASDILNDALDRLVDGRRVLQPTLITAVLNAEANAFFYAHVKRERGEDLMFVVDPADEEQIALLRGGREGRKVQVVSQFRRAEDLKDSTVAEPGSRDALRLEAYRIDATIAKGLGFSATTTIRLTARRDGVYWARFALLPDLDVDSVREEGGGRMSFFRAGKSPELWVRFDQPPRAGETRAARVAYHGDLIGFNSIVDQSQRWFPGWARRKLPNGIDRWLFVKTSYSWFPRYGERAADVDLTFHTPKRYRLASIGRLVGSSEEGDVVTSHWTTVRPADQVCFSLGEFDEFKITDPRIPPVTVHTNSDAHRQLDRFFLALRDQLGASDFFVSRFLSQRAPEQAVAGDVANSLSFFTRVYGAPLFDRYYAAEIPFSYGQAFPGLMYLPVWTFQAASDSGYDEILRSHEMAHQWWGIGVEPAGYRDAWVAEGFAEFSGLWYMQLILRDNEKFFRHLKHWRREVRSRRNDAPPIGIGWRAEQLNVRDYRLMTYYKGAWVLHMLRNLLIDLRTMNEDAFIAIMQDFYRQYRGGRASTRNFQKVVEDHVGIDMSWFFDEWVQGTAIPSYIFSWRAEPAQGGHYKLQLRVRQEDVPEHFMMPVPLQIGFADTSMHAYVRINVTGPVTEATLDLPAEPKRLEFNPLESVLAEVKQEDWN
jgi:Peptidase family M1 domain